jgi:glycosyltransferase involved in cell wall biosynthesis
MGKTCEFTPAPIVSVIIPTWNRRNLLRQTIESFFAQTAPVEAFEVIVVDDGSIDGTDAMVRDLQQRAPFRLNYHRMPRNGGPVLARNAGATIARADILAFTDSDCQASPQWVALAIAELTSDPSLAFLSGPAINVPGQRVRFFSIGGTDCPGENPTYPAANVIYRRCVFEELGGFDPTAFLYNAGPTPLDCSDVDLAWRVKERGHRNRYLDSLVIYHEVRHLKPWEWLAHYTRIMTIPELVRRHPGFGKTFLWWGRFCLPENPLFYAMIAGVLLAAVSPWFLLLALPFVLRIGLMLGSHCLRFRGQSAAASVARLPVFLVQVGLLGMRQAVICGSLIYGSIRSRKVVL